MVTAEQPLQVIYIHLVVIHHNAVVTCQSTCRYVLEDEFVFFLFVLILICFELFYLLWPSSDSSESVIHCFYF